MESIVKESEGGVSGKTLDSLRAPDYVGAMAF